MNDEILALKENETSELELLVDKQKDQHVMDCQEE